MFFGVLNLLLQSEELKMINRVVFFFVHIYPIIFVHIWSALKDFTKEIPSIAEHTHPLVS